MEKFVCGNKAYTQIRVILQVVISMVGLHYK